MIYGDQFNIRNANCYHHIQKYYSNLPNIEYIVLSSKEFLYIALENGFIEVNNPILGDVFITEEPHVHLMYYLGNQQVSHHPYKKLSIKEFLNGEMIKSIKYIVRRK